MQKKAPDDAKPIPVEVNLDAYRIADPEEFSRNMLRLVEEGGKAFSGFLERSNGKTGPQSLANDLAEGTKLFSEIAQSWWSDPTRLAEAHSALIRDLLQLAGATSQRMFGAKVPPVAEPEPGDNRFKDPEWEHNP